MIDPINVALLSDTSPHGSYVRIIDKSSVFAYGPNWSLLIDKTFDPNFINTLLSMQKSNTVFHLDILSTSTEGLLQGIANNTFKANGKMTTQTLSFIDNYWEVAYDVALQQIHYTNRPGAWTNLNYLAEQGKSKAVYSEQTNRRFIESSVPSPQYVLYTIDTNTAPILVAIPGSLLRFAQNMGISLMISTQLADNIEDIPKNIIPWAVGATNNSWMMIKPMTEVSTNTCNRLLHNPEVLVCWGSEELAKRTLLMSNRIYSDLSIIQSLHDGSCLIECDLHVEAKNLKTASYWGAFSKELFAIDILRYNGWTTKDIQSWMATSYYEAWISQSREILNMFVETNRTQDPESLAYLEAKGEELYTLLKTYEAHSGNPEITQIVNYIGETWT